LADFPQIPIASYFSDQVQPICTMLSKIDHIAIVVEDLEAALAVYRDTLGLALDRIEEIPAEEVKVAFLLLANGEAGIELVQPTTAVSGVARFLHTRGEGMHHVCFEVEDIEAAVSRLTANGLEVLEETPRQGRQGQKYVFVHPKTTHGVLLELYQRLKVG
jgi:methylmalonyl-CoA/ethylmalonyl-CoA epimerase